MGLILIKTEDYELHHIMFISLYLLFYLFILFFLYEVLIEIR